MRAVRIILVVIGLLAVVAAGLVIYVQQIDWSQYRPVIREAVRDATGRELGIAGDLQVEILPVPTLRARGLTFDNAPWASGAEMVHADAASFTVSLRSLLLGEVRVKTISLENTELSLETDSQGQGNWEFVSSGAGGEAASIFGGLDRISVDGLDVTWRPHGRRSHHLQIDHADVVNAAHRKGMQIDLGGVLNERPVKLRGELSTLSAYLAGRGISGRLTGSSPGVDIGIEGKFGRFPALDGLDLTLRASGTRWPAVLGLIELPDKQTPPWKAAFHVVTDGQSVRVTDLDMLLDKSDLAGELTFVARKERIAVTGTLTSSFLDISTPSRWWAGETRDDAEVKPEGKVFSHAQAQTAWMDALDADLRFRIGELKTDDFTANDADLGVALRDGRLEANLDAGVYGGTAKSRLTATAIADAVEYDSQLEILEADMGRVVRDWVGHELVEAKGSIQYDLAGRGSSVAEIMAGASGELRIAMGEGEARAGVAERAVRGFAMQALGALVGADKVDDDVKMNCFVVQADISDGIANLQVLVLDTEKATIFGSGTVNLADETLDLTLKPKPKQPTLNTAVPVNIDGTFTDPKFTAGKLGLLRKLAGGVSLFVFPPAAIAGFGEIGAGDNVCVKLAEDSK